MAPSNTLYSVPYNYLPEQFKEVSKFFDLWKPVLESGEFTLGSYVETFEQRFAKYVGAEFCVATNNGTDALILALRALGIGLGDEVITPANSFYATTGSIVAVGATPVFTDVDDRYQMKISEIQTLITPRTKAILPVHWAGASPDMYAISQIAEEMNIAIVEDACMGIGGKIHGRSPGTFSTIGAFSMHPLKTLNVAGDGGMVVTNNRAHYEWMKKYRNHGMVDRNQIEFWGVNMRLQPLQAVVANYFLDYVDSFIAQRSDNAFYLDSLLQDLDGKIVLPERPAGFVETYSLYMILAESRDGLMQYLFPCIYNLLHLRLALILGF
jgi:aminotransferase EvaB